MKQVQKAAFGSVKLLNSLGHNPACVERLGEFPSPGRITIPESLSNIRYEKRRCMRPYLLGWGVKRPMNKLNSVRSELLTVAETLKISTKSSHCPMSTFANNYKKIAN